MRPSNNDVIAVTLSFFTEVKGKTRDAQGRIDAPNSYKKVIMDEVASLLAGGHSPGELESLFLQEHPKRSEVYSVKELFDLHGVTCRYGQVEEDSENLLTPGRFYYHPFLQKTPGPPRVRTDEDGNMLIIEEPFFLEMRERLTLEELHEYFRNYFGWPKMSRKFEGAYRYLLKEETGYDVEELLFLGDCARADMDTNGKYPPINPLRLADYEEEMHEAMESRKNICYEGGLSHVKPRSRTENS